MERYAPNAKDLASRDVVSRSMTVEIREGRGVGKLKDHIDLHLEHLGPAVIKERLPGHRRDRAHFRRRGRQQRADSGAADRSLQHGRHSLQRAWRGGARAASGAEVVVPGLMAVGEAACVSVHGANRLGSNSLLDLVVFGREAAQHCARVVKPGTPHRALKADCARRRPLARLDTLRHAKGSRRTADIRLNMQRVMQSDAAVFRTAETLERRQAQARPRCSPRSRTSRSPTAR